MPRPTLMLAALFTISCMIFFGYSYVTRPQAVGAESTDKLLTEPRSQGAAASSHSTADAALAAQRSENTEQASSIPSDTVAKWIAEATSDDAKIRAAAITALAMAPKSQAIPVLKKVLNSGVIEDRQLALGSLRTLALQQGDANGDIRNVIRQAVYHGDDEGVTRSAQTTLDEIEGALGQTAPNTNP